MGKTATRLASALLAGSLVFGVSAASASHGGDGNLDPSFGAGGKVTTDFGASGFGRALAIQADGKLVAAGKADGDTALARYEAFAESGHLRVTTSPAVPSQILLDGVPWITGA